MPGPFPGPQNVPRQGHGSSGFKGNQKAIKTRPGLPGRAVLRQERGALSAMP